MGGVRRLVSDLRHHLQRIARVNLAHADRDRQIVLRRISLTEVKGRRVHRHAANAQKKDDRPGCMGRSRGGLTTKIHAVVDALGRPIMLKLSEGQAHDGRSAQDVLETLEAGDILLAARA